MTAAVLSLPKPAPRHSPLPGSTLIDLPRKPLPPGLPREWYIAHNRRLKTMRLAIALLDSGVYEPARAGDRRIRQTAELIGVHRPSDLTCRMVRALLGYGS